MARLGVVAPMLADIRDDFDLSYEPALSLTHS